MINSYQCCEGVAILRVHEVTHFQKPANLTMKVVAILNIISVINLLFGRAWKISGKWRIRLESQIIRLDHPLQGIKPKPVYFISDSCCCSSGSKATSGSFSWESKWKPREVEQLPLAGRWQLWWWQRRWRAGWWRPWRQARPRRPGKSGGFRIRWWK